MDIYFRSDCEYIKDVIKPFDWTYTTDYKGTVFGTDGNQLKVILNDETDGNQLKVIPNDEIETK